ncbi:MAG: hypothetical protein GWN84_20700 [Gammaproteobacteria bacterium]|nr:hypothetical protein [Gammaproteobacteria bacterium]NIR85181.1 hypothetical protein [Gammaproteobacteria bacterium]NIU06230.1 hypothetical protein [Gammaproteobacteria bacterium]NIX87503.1 hypothetical protein [Gammaproteobacteria bacterium]
MPSKRPRRYAEGTTVEPEKTRLDLQKLLKSHGADGFMFGEEGARSFMAFRFAGRAVRYDVPFPTEREGYGSTKRAEAEYRRRWRSLLLRVKAKLEAVASEDTTFEEEFFADLVVTSENGGPRRLYDVVKGQLDAGTMPRLLPGGEDA